MSLSERPLCEFAQRNKYGSLVCLGAEEIQPPDTKLENCAFQRYCALEQAWYHSDNYLKCVKRGELMAKNGKKSTAEKVLVEVTDVGVDSLEENTDKIVDSLVEELKFSQLSSPVEKEQMGKVIFIASNYIVVEYNENSIRKDGKFSVKIGDLFKI